MPTERIQKAINIFLDAINEGTLAAGTCTACAVGNLIAAGMGVKIEKRRNGILTASLPTYVWKYLFITYKCGETCIQLKNPGKAVSPEDFILAKQYISSTDFTQDELEKIEFAFEKNTKFAYFQYDEISKEEIRADQIRGLEAVVKVMLTFDEQTENVKEVFTKKAELIPIL